MSAAGAACTSDDGWKSSIADETVALVNKRLFAVFTPKPSARALFVCGSLVICDVTRRGLLLFFACTGAVSDRASIVLGFREDYRVTRYARQEVWILNPCIICRIISIRIPTITLIPLVSRFR